MDIKLPKPLDVYFGSGHRDPDAVASLFSDSATVQDEGKHLEGRDAIRQWVEESQREYQFTSEPLSVQEAEGKVAVRARVSGNFPGSPIELDYRFALADEQIESLEISG